jgi:hypothetical protein
MSTSPKLMGGLCLLGLTVAGIALGVYAGTTDPGVKPVNTVVHEEDAGWDCTTMGNRQCGPTPTVTVTAKPRPAPTVTVKARPAPTVTVTAKARPRPTVTATYVMSSTASPIVDGPGWQAVPQELGDALAEGESSPPENADTREWETCLVYGYPGDAITVVCPDGYVTSQ